MTLRNKLADLSDGEFYGGLRNTLRIGAGRIEFKPIPGLKKIAEALEFLRTRCFCEFAAVRYTEKQWRKK